MMVGMLGCKTQTQPITPNINYEPKTKTVAELPSPFKPLTATEKHQDDTKELLIGTTLAKEGDLFRACINLKRAEILAKDASSDRLPQIEYSLCLAYYLAQKYDMVIQTFEQSSLKTTLESFVAAREMELMLHDAYLRKMQPQQAEQMVAALEKKYPTDTYATQLYDEAMRMQWKKLPAEFTETYTQKMVSVRKAKVYNALIPGWGYCYVGQYKTGATAFLLNALFLVATYEFCTHGCPAAGIITAGFECGWYFGGIRGAEEAALRYNRHLYDTMAKSMLVEQKAFPILQFHYGF